LPWLLLSCRALDSGISGITTAQIEVKQQLNAAGSQKESTFDIFRLANSPNVKCLPVSINNKSYYGIVHGEIASNYCFPGGNIIPPSPDNLMRLPMCHNLASPQWST
jgi:hypothetical protein